MRRSGRAEKHPAPLNFSVRRREPQPMLPLDSPRWSQLTHAYGSAAAVPAWLAQLKQFPSSADEAEPWFSIWSALAHQGDVFASSYAAVPHVIEALASAPERADSSYVHFPVWVEICRLKGGPPIPVEFESAYVAALQRLPTLVAVAATAKLDPEFVACCMAAVAIAQGQPAMAEAALELNPEIAGQYLEWLAEQ